MEKGGALINAARKEIDNKDLDIVFVDMILAESQKDSESSKFSNKTSSTYIREYLAKQQAKHEV